MFNFDNITGGGVSALQLNATINFDLSDLDQIVHEADTGITATVDSYRSLMSKTLNESAGNFNNDTTLIMEQANEHVGQKIVKALQAFWNWLKQTAASIVAKLQSLVTSNKKLIEKIKPEVQKKLSEMPADVKKKLTAEIYEYDLNVIDVKAFVDNAGKIFKGAKYDVSNGYTEGNKDKVDQSVKVVNEMKHDDIASEAIKIIYKGSKKTLEEAKKEAVIKLRVDGKLKVKEFDMHYFEVIEKFDEVKKGVDDTYKDFQKLVSKMISTIESSVKEVPKGGDHAAAALASGRVAYFNAQRKLLMQAMGVVMLFSNLKLAAAKEQMTAARNFCIHAYNFKVQKEASEIVEPFNSILDAPGMDVDKILGETAQSRINGDSTFSW